MLTLYRRHIQKCAEARKREGAEGSVARLRADRAYRRCKCPIHAEGTLRIGGFIRKTTGEVAWGQAGSLKRKWEDAGTLHFEPPAELSRAATATACSLVSGWTPSPPP